MKIMINMWKYTAIPTYSSITEKLPKKVFTFQASISIFVLYVSPDISFHASKNKTTLAEKRKLKQKILL